MELTDEEREYLEHAIGAGVTEIYGGMHETVASACRKLGLNPISWQNERMLKD
jgi:hypothetical protein